jgi:catechol 2,3-dioxygenase-like lactoylglutathione lyase family enzyme
MKRLHVHLGVADLERSIEFYSRLFGQAPSRQESDYAKWMLEDPRINFAISARGGATGIDHLGIQVDSEAELAELHQRARAADESAMLEEGETTCCYAHSEKHWAVDPQGVAWEHFYTMGEVREFGKNGPAALLERQSARAGQVEPDRRECCGRN